MSDFLKKLIHGEEELSVNITSMIDVIFILLIFFMISTQFKKSSLPLDLPETDKSVTTTEDNSTKVLAVNYDSIELGGEIVPFENLEEKLRTMHEQNPEVAISLECEKTVEFERVVQILTKVQNAGITRIGIIHETMDN
ncbi:biopolymer transporter ExbD [Treponema pectinovorum]|uniref:ExbD/TolR family protein n=1 Tax=Treponema pectinovorum TaxID=164 RepID=UPI003D92D5E5